MTKEKESNWRIGKGTVFLVIFLALAMGAAAGIQELSYDSSNNATNISYDGLNRILVKNFSTGQHNYSYDGEYLGTLTNVTFQNGTIVYKYDDKLRLVEEARTIDGVRFEKKVLYDSADRAARQTTSPGTDVGYAYTAQGLIGRIAGFINSTAHSPFGSVLNRTYSSGKNTNFTYNAKSARLARINTDTIQNMIYSYDLVGNIMMINDTANDRQQIMGYDYLDRLLNMSINNGQSFLYSYDAIGNLLRVARHSNVTTSLIYGGKPVHAPSKVTTGQAGLDTYSEAVVNSSNKTKFVEFFIRNERNSTLDIANWSIEFGDATKINSTQSFNLTNKSTAFVLVEHDYATGGNYAVNITTGSEASPSDVKIVNVKFGLHIGSLAITSRNITNVSYQFVISNDLNENVNDATWECNNGLTSGGQISVNATSTRTISLTYNYSSAGLKNLSCTASSGNGNAAKSATFEVKGMEIDAYNRTSTNGSAVKVSFNITNHFFPTAADYKITSDGQTFTGTTGIIGTEASTAITQDINYTTAGSKIIGINITAERNLTNSLTDSFITKALEIEDYSTTNATMAKRVVDFWITNYWPTKLTATFNITDPAVTSTAFSVNNSEYIRVFIESDYTSQGIKTPLITAQNGTSANSVLDRFKARLIGILSYQQITETLATSITEAFIRNENTSRNVSWRFNTGSRTITSETPYLANAGEEIVIIIDSQYTEQNSYNSSLLVNSSEFNDTATGVAII